MREWSERHIRDLVRSEYGKIGGGGFGSKDMMERVADFLTLVDYSNKSHFMQGEPTGVTANIIYNINSANVVKYAGVLAGDYSIEINYEGTISISEMSADIPAGTRFGYIPNSYAFTPSLSSKGILQCGFFIQNMFDEFAPGGIGESQRAIIRVENNEAFYIAHTISNNNDEDRLATYTNITYKPYPHAYHFSGTTII